MILRRIFRTEGLWTNDVSYAKRGSDEGVRDDALGMAGDVGHDPEVHDEEGGDDSVDKEHAGQEGGFVCFGGEGHEASAEDTGDTAHY